MGHDPDRQRASASSRVDDWLEAAVVDVRKRGLEEMVPLLQGLAEATRQLRSIFSERADSATPRDLSGTS
jgi:hypothetical protein